MAQDIESLYREFQRLNEPRPQSPPTVQDPDRMISLDEFEDKVFQHYGVPRGLRRAIADQESGNNVNAVSPTGVKGKYQVTKRVAESHGLDCDDPFDNAASAARYLKEQYDAVDYIKDDRARWLGDAARYYGAPGAAKG